MTSWPQDAPSPTSSITAATDGDEQALLLLLRSFRPLVHRMALRIPAAYREDAEDEICLQLLWSLPSFHSSTDEDAAG